MTTPPGPGADIAEDQPLGCTASHEVGESRFQFIDQPTLGDLLASDHAAAIGEQNPGDFAAVQHRADDGMSGLMEGRTPILVSHAWITRHKLRPQVVEPERTSGASGCRPGLANSGIDVSRAATGGAARQIAQVALVETTVQMLVQDAEDRGGIRQWHLDPQVEAAGPQHRRIDPVGKITGTNHDHPFFAGEQAGTNRDEADAQYPLHPAGLS